MSTSAGSSSSGGLSMVNGTMPGWDERVEANPALDFVNYCLRGVGQVCFMTVSYTHLTLPTN